MSVISLKIYRKHTSLTRNMIKVIHLKNYIYIYIYMYVCIGVLFYLKI